MLPPALLNSQNWEITRAALPNRFGYSGCYSGCYSGYSGYSVTVVTTVTALQRLQRLQCYNGYSVTAVTASWPRLKCSPFTFSVANPYHAVAVFVGIHLGDTFARLIADVDHPTAAVDEQPAPTRAGQNAESMDDVLVAAAHQHGALTTSLVAGALGISNTEARRYLQWLVQEGRLEVVGRARGTKYVPSDEAADEV